MFWILKKFAKEIMIDNLMMKLTALVLSVWQWVADGSPSHTSTPVKIENALQFVPKNTNPKEFKKLQQQVRHVFIDLSNWSVFISTYIAEQE